MEEMKPLGTQNLKLKKRDESNIKTILGHGLNAKNGINFSITLEYVVNWKIVNSFNNGLIQL